jgi:hypothetical protein
MKKGLFSLLFILLTILTFFSLPANACIIGNPSNPPAITITNSPPSCCYGCWCSVGIEGYANNINTDSVAVVLYAQTNVYWVQPWADSPWTTIRCSDGYFNNGTHGGHHYCAILAKKSWTPPSTMGYLPPIGGPILAIACQPPERDTIPFSGYIWHIKQSGDVAIDPGPNYWSDSENNVWVDELGKLHLKLTYSGGKWYCPEVFTEQYLGYGCYRFEVEGWIDQLDPNVIFAGFIYSDLAKEIDIEFSRWGIGTDSNGQYVIQPWNVAGNRYRYSFTLVQPKSQHKFCWYPDSIRFESYQGRFNENGDLIQTWLYTGASNPTPNSERMRFNIWLLGGSAPINAQEVEVVISKFLFCSDYNTPVLPTTWGRIKSIFR